MATIVLIGGSSTRVRNVYREAAFDLGRRVARKGWILRTGAGGGASMMGRATDGALEAGGRVEGVILRKFLPIRHRGLHSLKVAATFERRKAALFRGGHAVVVLPGGYGTLDELGELLTLKQVDFTRMAILILNTDGFYDDLLSWARRAGRQGFLYGGLLYKVATTPTAAIRSLARSLGR